MPAVPSIPLFKVLPNVLRTARRPIEVFQEYHQIYGDNLLLSVGGSRRTHLTADPEVIQHVLQRNHRNYDKSEIQATQMAKYLGKGLLTNTGQPWLTQRRLIQPGFHRKRLDSLVTEMRAVIERQCAQLDAARAAGSTLSLHGFTRSAVFRIIARAIFTDGFSEQETMELNRTMDAIQAFIIYPVRMPFLRKPLRWIGREGKYLAMATSIRQRLQERIDARRAMEPQDDLLQMLLDSRYEDDGQPMADEQLIDEIMILFAAGHETSANALAWTIWLLLQHPEELAKVKAEIAAAKTLGPLDLDGVKNLPYLTQVIEESMRLYPPAWITDRVALGPDVANGYAIDTDTVVGIFIYGLHHNPRYWPEPERFWPERMSAAAKKDRHPYAFLPFGAGPRLCIGNHFAMLEMQLFLAQVLGDYTLELTTPAAEVGVKPYITLHMDREVGVRVC